MIPLWLCGRWCNDRRCIVLPCWEARSPFERAKRGSLVGASTMRELSASRQAVFPPLCSLLFDDDAAFDDYDDDDDDANDGDDLVDWCNGVAAADDEDTVDSCIADEHKDGSDVEDDSIMSVVTVMVL